MDPITRWLDSRFALLTACVAAAIVYGSLFPFQYRPNGSAIQILLATARTPLSESELAANILFYVPLGLAAAAALRTSLSWTYLSLNRRPEEIQRRRQSEPTPHPGEENRAETS